MKFRVQDDEVTFNVFKAMRHPTESDACFLVEIVKAIVSNQSGPTDILAILKAIQFIYIWLFVHIMFRVPTMYSVFLFN